MEDYVVFLIFLGGVILGWATCVFVLCVAWESLREKSNPIQALWRMGKRK